MWKEVECSSCHNLVFMSNREDRLCGNCKELKQLRGKVEQYEEILKEAMEAIRKNLVYAQFKDEHILYQSYQSIERVLKEREKATE